MLFLVFWVGCIVAAGIIAQSKKLSVGLYVVLGLFLGPIAIFIALIEQPKTGKNSTSAQNLTLHEARQHLEDLKRNLRFLEQKAQFLEKQINQLSPSELKSQSPSETEPLNLESPTVKAVEPRREEPVSSENFELAFGKYWLNRIGVVLFVMGIGFFISYSFQYLNAFARVSIGYAFAVAFYLFGNRLEKSPKYRKIAWGFLGGAWGLLYLSTYAMYYIDATRIITNSTIESLLLAVVTIAAVYANLKYNSWVVTAMTFVLAFITGGLGRMDFSSIFYFSLLTSAIAFMAYKKSWHEFLIFGIIGSYITHIYWVNNGFSDYWTWVWRGHAQDNQFPIIFSILTITWVIYSVVFFVLNQNNAAQRKHLLTALLLNGFLYVCLGLYEISRVSGWGIDEQYLFLAFLSTAYFLFAFVFKLVKRPRLIVVNVLIGFSLFGAAIFIRMPELSVAFYWILEMVVLFVLGVYYKEKLYRACAGFLSILVMLRLWLVDLTSDSFFWIFGIFGLEHDVVLSVFAALCFYVLGIVAQKLEGTLDEDERSLYSWWFPIFGTVVLTWLIADDVATRWISLSWTFLGAGLLSFGFLLKAKVFRLNALCVLSLTALRVVFVDMSELNTLYKIAAFTVLGALLLGISMVYSNYKIKNR